MKKSKHTGKEDKKELKSDKNESKKQEENLDGNSKGFRIFSSGEFRSADKKIKDNKISSKKQSDTKEHAEKKDLEIKLLNINIASEEQLAGLPGVGVILAKKAIQIRNERGSFESIQCFAKDIGINPRIFERIKGFINVEDDKK